MKFLLLSIFLLPICYTGFPQIRYESLVRDSVSNSRAPVRLSFRQGFNSTTIIPADFYARHLPFFCREELKMKHAGVPVSLRLGSLENCDMLEEKNKSH